MFTLVDYILYQTITESTPNMPVPTPLKTVVVLGAAYAGARPIGMLAAQLPLNWRIVVIDRSTHFCRKSKRSHRRFVSNEALAEYLSDHHHSTCLRYLRFPSCIDLTGA
jgi:hypothetical protein